MRTSKLAFTMGVLCLAVGAASVKAQPAPYTFSGTANDLFRGPITLTLSGGFNIDPNATSITNISEDGLFRSAVYSSPLNQIWGTFGDWTFSGTFSIYVSDGPVWLSPGHDWSGEDHWIIRSQLAGPLLNGWTPLNLNLFYYTSPGGINSVDLFPPHDPLLNPSADPYDLQFTLNFMDETGAQQFTGGPLFEIQSVPEPVSATLIVLGLISFTLMRGSAFRRAESGG